VKKITQRQLIIFYCIYSFAIKFLLLPQLLTRGAANDAWIAALAGTIIELFILWVVLQILTKNKDNDIFSIPSTSERGRLYANFMRRIPLLLMLFIFLLQLMILTKQSFYLLSENMFENLPPYMFIVPMLMLGVYFCFTSSNSLFRSGEIFYAFLILGLIVSVLPAFTQINAREALPLFSAGLSPVLTTALATLIYFESASFLLMFSGEVKIEKNFQKKFMTTAAIVGAFFVFFVFMFWSLFLGVSSSKNVAVANMTGYSSVMAQGGRTGWILVSIWLLLLLLRFGVTFFCAFKSIKYITGVKKRTGIISVSLAIFIFLLSSHVFTGMREMQLFIENIRWIILALYLIIPLLFFIATKRKGGKHV